MADLGTRVKDYEIWGRLGEGGMSDVWLAKHSALKVPVIIKTLKGHVDPALALERILLEAQLTARITNPRVVRALDAGMHMGVPYLVQEYADGIDLDELDTRRREALGVGLPLWFVCHAMADIARALHAAHQTGVIHRDVKPANMFGSPATGVRLGDFGIAVLDARGGAATACDISGTLSFMAPELFRGEAADRATDVYGAGASACFLRYGTHPFPRLDEVLDEGSAPRFPPAEHPAEAYFQDLLRKMLCKRPAGRFAEMATPGRHFSLLARALKPASLRAPLVCEGKHTFRVAGCTVRLRVGDIASAEVDGIVSSAHSHMLMRTGVGDALRRRGGDIIEAEAAAAGDRALGECVATTAGTLHAKRVLHAVSAWNEASCVGRAMQRAFLLADELGLATLAAPALGTGAARVSLEGCAAAMMTALRVHMGLGGTRLRELDVVFDSATKLAVFQEVAEEALRDEEASPAVFDIGVPVDVQSVRADSATHVNVQAMAAALRAK